MKTSGFLFSAFIGAVASARSMTPMATLAAAQFMGRRTPGQLVLLGRPLVGLGAMAMVRIGQARSGLIEDARVLAAGVAVVALATRPRRP